MTSKSIVLYYIGQDVSLREIADAVQEKLKEHNYIVATELYIDRIKLNRPYILIMNPLLFEGLVSSLNTNVDERVRREIKKLTKDYPPECVFRVTSASKDENVRLICEELMKKEKPVAKNVKFWETF